MSMYPDVFQIAASDTGVTSILGSSPTRLWPFGLAPQPGTQLYGVPYAVHQLAYGTPVNTLSCVPDMDNFGVQFDCYATSATDARNAAAALRDAYEGSQNQVVAWNGEDWEQATGLYRVSFTVEFWTERSAN